MSSDHGVERSDRRAALGEVCGQAAVLIRGVDVEVLRCKAFRERVDQLVELLRVALVRAEAKFGKRDGADAEFGRLVVENARSDVPLAAQCEANGVGVEHVLEGHSKGSLRSAARPALGRSMSSDQAPRQRRKVAGHWSTGSRMTLRPSR